MGLFNLFSKKSGSRQSEVETIKDERRAECPYCSKALLKIPSRKTKCPHCDNFMLVRTHPNDRTKIVVTEEQAAAIDYEWESQQAAKESLGGESEFFNEKARLKERFGGKEPSIGDIKWSLWNKRFGEAMKKNDFSTLSGIYFQMGLHKHELGKSSLVEQQQAQKMQLYALKQNEVVLSVEIFSKDGCEECKRLNGKKFTIADAIKLMPIPCINCQTKLNSKATSGWCRCSYLPVVSD